MTSTRFWDFLTPPPSLSAQSILFVHKFRVFLDPPFCSDVMYGSPLGRRAHERGVVPLVRVSESEEGDDDDVVHRGQRRERGRRGDEE